MNEVNLLPDHPICSLYFVFDSEFTDDMVSQFEKTIDSRGTRRDWVIAAPQVIEHIEDFPDGGKIHTYGVTLQMYSPLPPWDERLPKRIDRLHFEEASLVKDALCGFSQEFDSAFVVELDQTHVGSIENGKGDECLQIGLFAEWEKALGS